MVSLRQVLPLEPLGGDQGSRVDVDVGIQHVLARRELLAMAGRLAVLAQVRAQHVAVGLLQGVGGQARGCRCLL